MFQIIIRNEMKRVPRILRGHIAKFDKFEIFPSLRTHLVVGAEHLKNNIPPVFCHTIGTAEGITLAESIITDWCVSDTSPTSSLIGRDDSGDRGLSHFDGNHPPSVNTTLVFCWANG
jgi:hypothetical protein